MEKKKVNYKDMLTKSAAKAKQDSEDFDEKAPSFRDLKNKAAKKSWEERKFAHDRGEKQKNYFEGTKPTFKQFISEWVDENFQCVECGEKAAANDKPCEWCGSVNYTEADHEPAEYYGEPEESWQERNQRLLRKDGLEQEELSVRDRKRLRNVKPEKPGDFACVSCGKEFPNALKRQQHEDNTRFGVCKPR
jgi:hypothetical protein